MIDNIQYIFNAASENYDEQRKKLIPCFDDFYEIALNLSDEVPYVNTILDIGAGTGLLSNMYSEKYPLAKIDLVDISEEMLIKAIERLEGKRNIEFILQDFLELEAEDETYDLVISALAIHHLNDEMKQKLFNKIFHWLRPGGIFINADQVLGANEFSEKIHTYTWRSMVENNSELSKKEKESAFERIKLDKMTTLENQLKWLNEIGFRYVDNFYQYYNFVVFAAKK